MASPTLLSLFTLLSLLTLSPSTAQTTITLSLSPPPKSPHKTPWQRLTHLASSSIARANHLKHPHKRNYSVSMTDIPLFPHTYGGYSVSLGLGTPPQTLSLLLDTGSSLVWVPCTTHYTCTKCDFPNVNHANISTFVPRQSSSAKVLGCKNPKCAWLFGPSIRSQCEDCTATGNCTRICPEYGIQYGSGSTSGILLSETLELPEKSVQDFLVGCSIVSTRQPSGIVGFGQGPESLPAQMGLKKFSYCLVSHRFDEKPVTSDLTLTTGSHSGATKSDIGLSYTPFLKNKLGADSAFEEYYYVNLRKITVGGKHARVPYDLLVPGSDGHGGTIVDSGTTFTFMEGEVYEAVAREFERQMAHYSRDADVENRSGFRPCYNVSGGGKEVVLFPELVFHFKGGGKMELPLADYFSVVGESMAVCMTIVTDTGGDTGGPSIILGNYQQQDIYLEFDLENERLGFRKQTCK